MPDKVTTPKIRGMKGRGEKIVCVTAYDAPTAKLADEAGVDLILVGDSVGDVVLGYPSTLPVTLEEMLHHTRAVRRGTERALLVADMPFGSYQSSIEKAMESAIALMKAGAEAVKVEGNSPAIRAMVESGIPVMGHVGLTPQSIHQFGGHKVQGKGEDAAHVKAAAKNIESQGAFSIVLEVIPSELAAEITRELAIPTIGIGAGAECDGQVQVLHDVLGLSEKRFKHAKAYLEGRTLVAGALAEYVKEVKEGAFPKEQNSF